MTAEQSFLRNSKEWPACNIGVRRRDTDGNSNDGSGIIRAYDPLTVILSNRTNMTYKSMEALLEHWAITQH